jgi:hypothetical protein
VPLLGFACPPRRAAQLRTPLTAVTARGRPPLWVFHLAFATAAALLLAPHWASSAPYSRRPDELTYFGHLWGAGFARRTLGRSRQTR